MARRVARRGKKYTQGFGGENLKKRDYLEDLDADGRIIRKLS